jgi:hypothetical protein
MIRGRVSRYVCRGSGAHLEVGDAVEDDGQGVYAGGESVVSVVVSVRYGRTRHRRREPGQIARDLIDLHAGCRILAPLRVG